LESRSRNRPLAARKLNSALIGLVAASLASATFGCSGNVARVSGTVLRKDGSPVSGARVIARSEGTGKTANAETDSSGHYALGIEKMGDGVPPGDYYVIVLEDLGEEHTQRPPTIAAKYAKPSMSGLRFSVKAGEKSTFDMSLEKGMKHALTTMKLQSHRSIP